MEIKQIYDEGLAQASYVLLSDGQVMVVDPARNPQPYYDYAKENNARITGVIETHPHADFVSSHLEIHQQTGATIYVSRLVGAAYPHQAFDDNDVIEFGDVRLKAFNTPGHSPDSICVLVEDQEGRQKAVFTGDTLFVGDVGRPDLRENADQQQEKKEKFARQMYHSLRDKLMVLDDEVTVYPAHGAGSLCGIGMSDERSSTIGKEKSENPALQSMSEGEFVDWLLEGKLFIPKYFSYNVALNIKGAAPYEESIKRVPRITITDDRQIQDAQIVDVRDEAVFKNNHFPGAINIMLEGSFETWLGSLIAPEDSFYLIADSTENLTAAMQKAAKIGYESKIKGALLSQELPATKSSQAFNPEAFKADTVDYTIVDVRNKSEVEDQQVFENAMNIPLHELQDRHDEIPEGKPIVVHCGSGYRSAAGSSILEAVKAGKTEVYDLSDAIKDFK